jgi:hypothetical protein
MGGRPASRLGMGLRRDSPGSSTRFEPSRRDVTLLLPGNMNRIFGDEQV